MFVLFFLVVFFICVFCYRLVVLVYGMFGFVFSEFGKIFENWIKSVSI